VPVSLDQYFALFGCSQPNVRRRIVAVNILILIWSALPPGLQPFFTSVVCAEGFIPPDLGCLDTRQCTASCSFHTVIDVKIRYEQSGARSRFLLQPSAAGFIASMCSAFQLPCIPGSGGGPSFIHWQAALVIRTGGSSRALYQ
jgi:hypothetical protein